MKTGKIKKITIWTLAMLLLILLLVLIIRTMSYKFPELHTSQTENASGHTASETAARRLSGGIRIPTVSVYDLDETNGTYFEQFKQYLIQSYPVIFENLEFETINNYGLVLRWEGRDSGLDPILLLSHYDVVPVTGFEDLEQRDTTSTYQFGDTTSRIDEYPQRWDYAPFSGAVAQGKIYGRGTLDMKGMLFSIMEAVESLLKEEYIPDRDVWIAFGQDEEIGGLQGAVQISQYFASRGMRFDAVYDEGGIINLSTPGAEGIPVALIGTGEKGFLTVSITVRGIGGHSSMPPAKGSLVMAGEIITKLNNHQLKPRLIEPTSAFMDNISGGQSFFTRMVIANKWLFRPLLLNQLTKNPASNALVRTTTAVTMAKGSDAANVLSSSSQVTVNFRILPGETVQDIVDHVEEVCSGYDVDIEVLSAREPSAVSRTDTRGYDAVKKALAIVYPNALISPYITIGGTDAYKYQPVSDNIYRFMPVSLNQYEQRTIHNENEHISVDNYGRMIEYFRNVILLYDRD